MEAPRDFSNAEPAPFQLKFNVAETRESTEEKPVLIYERNGFVFKVRLDLIQNTSDIALDVERPESFTQDWEVLRDEVQKLAEKELQKRREEYGETYFS